MAQELAVRGTKLLIAIGDGASPEVFDHPCVINTDRSFSIVADTVDSPTYDCDDPDASGWKQREKTDLSADISGSGRLYTADLSIYDDWVRSLDPKNVQIIIDEDSAHGGGSWEGAYHLTNFTVSAGGKGTTVEVQITLQSTGALGEFEPASP